MFVGPTQVHIQTAIESLWFPTPIPMNYDSLDNLPVVVCSLYQTSNPTTTGA